MSTAPATASTGAQRLKDVREWLDATAGGPSLGQRAEAIYTTLLITAIFGAGLFDAVHHALAEIMSVQGTQAWGPGVVVLGLLVTARWGAYQGPVVYAVADVAHLLGAPLPRRALASRRLLLAYLGGAVAGAALAGVAVTGLAGHGTGITPARGAGLVVAGALLGPLGVACAWAVQASARVERALGPLTWLALLAAGGVGAVAASSDPVRDVLAWTGPWGWAIAPAHAAAWPAALALLAAVSAAAAWTALTRCGQAPAERHLRRAEARAGAAASLAGFDARSMRKALRDVAAKRPPRQTGRLRWAGRSRVLELVIAWRGATALRRTPGRVAEALVLGAGGAAVMLAAADRPTAALIGGVLLFLAATRVLEPLREEVDAPGRTRLLIPAAWGRILLAHTLLPGAVLVLAVALATGACLAAGAVIAPAGAIAAVAVLAIVPATLAAALSGRRGGRLPMSVLSMASATDPGGGSGGFLIIGYLLLWPGVAVIGAGAPAALVGHNGVDALQPAILLQVVVTSVLWLILRRSARP